MLRYLITGAVCAAFSMTISASEISIKGKVVDSDGIEIQRARVSLLNSPEIVAYTDDAGAFTLYSTAVVRLMKTARACGLPYISNNRICFTSTASDQPVTVQMFTPDGSRIFINHFQNITSGSHSFTLPHVASGLYITQIAIGNQSYSMQVIAGINGINTAIQNTSHNSSSMLKSALKAEETVDTLIVTADEYKHQYKALNSYSDEGIEIKLEKSNPWIPNNYASSEGTMVKVHAKGFDFEMGQPDPNIDGKDATKNETQVHTVKFTSDYWVDSTEVTQEQYTTIMAAYSDFTAPEWSETYGLGDNYPAYYVSWGDAALYCNAKSKFDGLDTVYSYTSIKNKPGAKDCELVGVTSDLSKNGYRLPTEAEWEYLCKGGVSKDFNWVQNYKPYPENKLDTGEINGCAVWKANSWLKGEGKSGYGAQEVAKLLTNNYNLYDIEGNLSEWCNEYTYDSYGSKETVTDPEGQKTGSEDSHVIRGGNWSSDVAFLRSACRTFKAEADAGLFQGFRCLKRIVE
ncbi:MAG: SUMF1/EgtB/PvdO family nonheme iron enzyme [Fibrobacter sp.]|nr:SUMF1/EgtB/PvdO family nonheme iron enzyme [Fibrobacter sp.]